jgi:hypothetical protein
MCCRKLFLLLTLLTGIGSRADVVAYWDADRAVSGWRDSAWQKGGTGRMHFDQDVKRHGFASVRLEGLPDREIHVSSVTSHIRVKPDGKYVMRFWTRRTGADGAASCQILAHRMADEQHSKPIGWVRLGGKDRLEIPVSEEWEQHEVPLGALPGGTERVYFYFRVKGDTTLWIDEFSLADEGTTVLLGGKAPLTDADYAGIRLDPANLPTNLLLNGSFEEGMKEWQTMSPSIRSEVDTGKAAAGKASLLIHGREFTAGGMYQRVRIDPRYRYRLSFRADAEKLVGYFFTKVLRFDRERNPRGWLGDEVLYSARSGKWAECSGEFTPTPGTDHVVVYLRVEDTVGDVWVDEVRLTPLPMTEKGGDE